MIFDLDGTLVDSVPDMQDAVNKVLAGEGHTPLDLQTFTSFVGDGLPTLVRRVMANKGIVDEVYARLYQAILELYNTSALEKTVVYAGVFDVLEALQAQGYRLGICSNKPEAPARHVLEVLGLAPYFSVLIGGDSTAKRKPDPYPLHHTIAALDATEVIYVGDSEVDAATAAAAGVKFALFTEGYRKTDVSEIAHDWSFSRFDQFLATVGLSAK